MTLPAAMAILHSMILPPDDSPPSPPEKPKITSAERRLRQVDRLTMVRLRMAIWHKLEELGITTPAENGVVLGMPAAEANSLLIRHHWREGDVALLEAAAARLGAQVPPTAVVGPCRQID